MIVIKAGKKIIINPVELYVTVSGDQQYHIEATTSNAYGDYLSVWPLDGKGTSLKAAEEMLDAIFKAIARHFKSPLPNVHVDIELVESHVKTKKESDSKPSTVSMLAPEEWNGEDRRVKC